MSVPSRDTPAGRAYLDLQKKARAEGRPTDELLALYALEGFLGRLAVSEHIDNLVLKGGVLLAAYDTRRPTNDIDFQARTLANEADTVLGLVRKISSIERDDGLIYDVADAMAEVIRDADEYSGVRVVMTCHLARANIRFHVDVNVGDPVWPAPMHIDIPLLLGGSIVLSGYPLEMVHAEKIVTAVQRGIANTRWRDFADIYLLSRRHEIDGTRQRRSMMTVAVHRSVLLEPLADVLTGYAEFAQVRWANWVRKQRLDDRLPIDFSDILTEVQRFADPVLTDEVDGRTWDPAQRTWTL